MQEFCLKIFYPSTFHQPRKGKEYTQHHCSNSGVNTLLPAYTPGADAQRSHQATQTVALVCTLGCHSHACATSGWVAGGQTYKWQPCRAPVRRHTTCLCCVFLYFRSFYTNHIFCNQKKVLLEEYFHMKTNIVKNNTLFLVAVRMELLVSHALSSQALDQEYTENRVHSTQDKHNFWWVSETTEWNSAPNLRVPITQHGGKQPLQSPILTCYGVDNGPKDRGRFYQFFEDVWLSSQGKPIVKHFFQYLINHDHIVFDHWLWTHSKIILVKT